MGLKGRFEETKKDDDHRLADATYPVACLEGDRIITRDVPALTALNERLRDDYIADCQRGVDRWNRTIKEHGIDVELRLPHRGFHRAIGSFGEAKISPDGRVITEAEWDARRREGPPAPGDAQVGAPVMRPAREAGRLARWLSAPRPR